MGLKRWVGSSYEGLKSMVGSSFLARAIARSSLEKLLKEKFVISAYVGSLLLFSAGLVNAILEGSRPQFKGGLILITRSAQSITETMLNAFTIMLGTGGVYLIYLSSRQLRPRISGFFLFLGLAVLILSLSLGYYMVLLKRF